MLLGVGLFGGEFFCDGVGERFVGAFDLGVGWGKFEELDAEAVGGGLADEGGADAGEGFDGVADADAALFELGEGGVEVVDFEGEVVEAFAAAFDEAHEGAVGLERRCELEGVVAEGDVAGADAEGSEVGMGVGGCAEECFEGRAGAVTVSHGEGDVVDAFDAHGWAW